MLGTFAQHFPARISRLSGSREVIHYLRAFLQANPTVRIHYTPTYSSWLNQVEIWFSKIQRDVISRGIFTSTTDLSRKLIRYIKQYKQNRHTLPLES